MRNPLLVIFLTVFIDLVGFGIIIPLLALYGQQFGASGAVVGLIFAAFSAFQFLCAPFWGRLSDRVGRRPVLLMTLGGGVAAYALLAYASTLSGRWGLGLLLASRVLAGVCGGNLGVAQAFIADISPPEKRSARMGLIGVAFGLGFIFGPIIGSFSSHYGQATPGWIATGLCAANFLLACLVLPESRKPGTQPTEPRPRWAQWSRTFQQPQVRTLIVLFFLATFCFAAYETTLALLAQHLFQFGRTEVGYLFTFVGVISVLVQGGMIRPLVKRWGEPPVIAVSFLLFGLGLVLLPYLTKVSTMLFGLGLLSLGASMNRPPTFGLISNLTSEHEQGATLGVAQSAGSLARILGPSLAGPLFDLRPDLPYVLCGVISLFAAVLAWRSVRPVAKA